MPWLESFVMPLEFEECFRDDDWTSNGCPVYVPGHRRNSLVGVGVLSSCGAV